MNEKSVMVEGIKRPAGQDEGNKRAQRVMLRFSMKAHVDLGGKPNTFTVTTVSVNPNGALLVAPQLLTESAQIVLENPNTRERATCRVVRAGKQTSGGYEVPIAFDPPAPNFWKIDFPPSDWRTAGA
ncbi:MAG: hypothetical protein WB869_09815 [Candidatus Acidiferrales bacterium]